jgi:hypothetical protein
MVDDALDDHNLEVDVFAHVGGEFRQEIVQPRGGDADREVRPQSVH